MLTLVFYGLLLCVAVVITIYRRKAKWYNLVVWCIIVVLLCIRVLLEG